jgi:hypothetical protein
MKSEEFGAIKVLSRISRFGGVVVSVLATGPEGCGFEPGK